jgi:phenylpropionate dioxygenase-like ring-hydroxylating dioxygenase large terminal subunit
MPFLRNTWYVAGWSEELGLSPIRRRILNEQVALFRLKSGEAVGLGDRCPHRFASLGEGKVVGDALECPYHGLRFDAQGACVHNPHGGVIPKAAKVKRYPVVERYHAIWIWPGDSAAADPSLIPDFSMFLTPDMASSRGYLHVLANYELVNDNLLDLSHVAYLHPFLSNPDSPRRIRTRMNHEGNTVWSYFWQKEEPITPFFRTVWDSPSEVGDLRAHMRWTVPSNLYLDAGMTEVGASEETGPAIPTAHLLTPETETATHYFWMVGRNRQQTNTELGQMIHEGVAQAFVSEDEPMIARVYENMAGADLFSLRPVLLPGDAAAVQARRLLAKAIELEGMKTIAAL